MDPRPALVAALAVAAASSACQAGSTATSTPTATVTVTPTTPTPTARTTYDLRFRVRKPYADPVFRRPIDLTTTGTTPVFITYSAFLEGIGDDAGPDDPLKGECYVVQGTSPDFADRTFYTADDSGVSLGDDLSFSGSGVVDPAQGGSVFLECELNEGEPRELSWRTDPDEPIQVTVTPVEGYRGPSSGPSS